eukprot:SAG31_NODE_17305_length_676_cov_0.864818_1_plen_134_part_01
MVLKFSSLWLYAQAPARRQGSLPLQATSALRCPPTTRSTVQLYSTYRYRANLNCALAVRVAAALPGPSAAIRSNKQLAKDQTLCRPHHVRGATAPPARHGTARRPPPHPGAPLHTDLPSGFDPHLRTRIPGARQ